MLLCFAIVGIFIHFAPKAFSIDWPSLSGLRVRNFGWNDAGFPHLGVSFEDNGSVFAAKEGDLLFQHRNEDSILPFPSPLGSWAAIDHSDGLISIYSRMGTLGSTDADGFFTDIPLRLEKGDHIGESGISGWALERGLYFQLFDRKERSWTNPETIIVSTDTRQPVIGQVQLRNSEGTFFPLPQTSTVAQGNYSVVVNAASGTINAEFAPYQISAFLNGRELATLTFESYSVRDGLLTVQRNGLVPVREVYAVPPGYEAAQLYLNRGQATLQITVQQLSGAARTVVHRFTVH